MTYEADELSIQSGAPVELYTFTRRRRDWALHVRRGGCDGRRKHIQHLPRRSGARRDQHQRRARRAALRITVARDHPVAALIHLRPRTGVIGCTVSRYHRGDDTDVIVIYAGRVLVRGAGKR